MAASGGAREGQHQGHQGQHGQQASVWMTSPYRVRMRAKTPSQFPTELASLDEKLEDMDERLELVRKGKGLFKLMQDREMEKVILVTEFVHVWIENICAPVQLCEDQLAAQMEEETRRNAWAEPEVTSQVSLSNANVTSANGSASPEASVIRRER